MTKKLPEMFSLKRRDKLAAIIVWRNVIAQHASKAEVDVLMRFAQEWQPPGVTYEMLVEAIANAVAREGRSGVEKFLAVVVKPKEQREAEIELGNFIHEQEQTEQTNAEFFAKLEEKLMSMYPDAGSFVCQAAIQTSIVGGATASPNAARIIESILLARTPASE